MDQSRKQTRIVFFGLSILLIVWLILQKTTPLGYISYSYNFNDYSAFIHKFRPLERLKIQNKTAPNVAAGNPIYFSVRAPHQFNTAQLEIRYKRNAQSQSAPIIEAGALVDKKSWQYSLKPLENSIIDKAGESWNVSHDNSLHLLQRNQRYATVDDFLTNPPDWNEIAVYQASLNNDFRLKDYTPSADINRIAVGLRDQFQFYTYIKNEDLNFTFEVVDLNQKQEATNIEVLLYENNKIIQRVQLGDDGIVDGSGTVGKRRTLELKATGLTEGVKKIELRSSSDIVTDNIVTTQSKLAFLNKIYLSNSGAKNISLFTKAKKVSFQTPHPDSLQKINLNGAPFDLSEGYKQFQESFSSQSSTTNKIILEKDGVIISSNDSFAFAESQYFNPNIKKIDNETNLDSDGINFILTSYKPQQASNEWQTRMVSLDAKSAQAEKDGLSFIISAPGLENGGELEFDYVGVKLESENIFSKIKRRLHL